jgi:hypothetical protein
MENESNLIRFVSIMGTEKAGEVGLFLPQLSDLNHYGLFGFMFFECVFGPLSLRTDPRYNTSQ